MKDTYKTKSGYWNFLAEEIGHKFISAYDDFADFENTFYKYHTHILIQEYSYRQPDDIVTVNVVPIGVYDNMNNMAQRCRQWLHYQLDNYIDICNESNHKQEDFYPYISTDWIGGSEFTITVYPKEILQLNNKLNLKTLKLTFIEFNQAHSINNSNEGDLWRMPSNY